MNKLESSVGILWKMEFEKRKCNTVLLLQDDNSDGKRKYVGQCKEALLL